MHGISKKVVETHALAAEDVAKSFDFDLFTDEEYCWDSSPAF